MAEQQYVNDDNNDDDDDNGNDSGNNNVKKDNYNNSNNIHTSIHYLVNAINKNFPNIKMKPMTTQEIENIIKFLKPKNTYGYNEIPTKLLKLSSVYISLPLNHICKMLYSETII